MLNFLWPHGLYSPWNSPGQNTGVGSLSLLQGIFPTQGSNPDLPHCRQILYSLSHKGSPRMLEWVAYPSPSRSSRPRNLTRVSCIAGRFFTNWTIREEENNKVNDFRQTSLAPKESCESSHHKLIPFSSYDAKLWTPVSEKSFHIKLLLQN